MSLEENKALIRRAFEGFNKRSWSLIEELSARDYVDHTHRLQGREANRQFLTTLVKGFPDFHMAIEDMIAEGDKVWVYFKETGTHTGEWNLFGITFAPAGRKVTETAVHMYRIVGGKIVEGRSISDSLDFLRQLGVIEYTEKAKKLFPENVK